jgi:primosomal protein N' (replication factor Y)
MGQVKVGDRVRVIFSNKKYLGVVSAVGIAPEVETKRVLSIINIEKKMRKILPEEIKLWKNIADYYLCTIGEVYKTAYPSEKINREESHLAAIHKIESRRKKMAASMEVKIGKLRERLEKKQIAETGAKDGTKSHLKIREDIAKITAEIEATKSALTAFLNKNSSPDHTSTITPDSYLDLTEAQKVAYSNIKDGFQNKKPVLLHGVTGSGKTELYITLAKECIETGKNVLYLVPEIALSRQLEDRLDKHFGSTLMTYHSGKSSVVRNGITEKMSACSNGYIVLGTRSSLFLPHHNLGLIIVDEEHDNSYKQDSPAPYYNGRDTALMLSVIHKCNIILGSATPSLEERYNCLTGKHFLVELRERYFGASNSEIEIIDTKAERRKNGMRGSFSIKLIERINEALSKGEQVMILRSRRAWAPILQCDVCGDIPKCPHCNVSLSLHKSSKVDYIRCHYCGYHADFNHKCNKCGGELKPLGAGTQKIEEEAKDLFPTAEIARLDSDITQNKTLESKIIKDFESGKINILIGTQIVTKGFDFSRLNLVAVIAADSLLGMQDFRADEKAIQLLEQFRGRCGRRGCKGTLIIQTSQPEHPVYSCLVKDEEAVFNSLLMTERKDFGFPPFTRIIEVNIKDIYEDRAERMSFKLANSFKSLNITITGPYAPVISKIADSHIRAIRICLNKDRYLPALKKAIIDTIRMFEKENRYTGHIQVNADPS